ncbi:hypothetical protein ACNVED_07975 [Legionella sp. D16C41]|uniref:hypothetical protein n=1 Tax=Legionella sp. D16C41 TaxID=3402688 RepID=UPI003AF60463
MPKDANTLVTAWNPDKQAAYEFIKKLSIQAVTNQVGKCKNFEDLYNFTAGLRKKIAELLNQPDKNDLGRLRVPKSTSDTMKTIIDNSGRYASFYNDILILFKQIEEKYKLEKGANSVLHYGISDIKKINSVGYHIVEYNGITYSTLNLIHAQDKNNADVTYLRIDHTNDRDLPKIFAVVDTIYNRLSENISDSEKSELIKEIAWHLAQGMPCFRGSAAICEILYEALLNINNLINISSSEPNDIPLDLKAIFTASPVEFSRLVSIQSKQYQGTFSKLKQALTDFSQIQTGKEEPSFTFFLPQGQASKIIPTELETNAAKKILALLEGNLDITFTSEEKELLEKGALAQLLDSYKDEDGFNKEHLYFFTAEQELTQKNIPS